MTPKEKAKELCNKFLRTYKVSLFPPFNKASDEAKQCALIAVEEILQLFNSLPEYYLSNFEYWEEVKAEIEKL